MADTSINDKNAATLNDYSKIGVFSPSGSRDVYFSIIVFLAFILSKIAQNLTLLISVKSKITLGVKIFNIPGDP